MPDVMTPAVLPRVLPELGSTTTPSTDPSGGADLDRMLHAWQSQFTGRRSPNTLGLAFLDWATHAANAPFQTAALGGTAIEQWMHFARTPMAGGTPVVPRLGVYRFVDPNRQRRPYDLLTQSVLLSGAEAAGAVLGARLPIVLASRSDNASIRMASCALGVVVARAGVAA